MHRAVLLVAAAFLAVPAFSPLAWADAEFGAGAFKVVAAWATDPVVVDDHATLVFEVWGPPPAPFDTGAFVHGATAQVTFTFAGAFSYFDAQALRGGVVREGNITVANATRGESPASFAVTVTKNGFAPENLTLHTGDSVVWTNNDTALHEVKEGTAGSSNPPVHPALVPILGLNKTVAVSFVWNGHQSGPFPVHDGLNPNSTFAPAFAYGSYAVAIVPQEPGVYSVHFKGSIEGTSVDDTVALADEPVLNLSQAAFPGPALSNGQILGRLSSDENGSGAPSGSSGGVPAPPTAWVLAAVGVAAVVAVAVRGRTRVRDR
jgi:plastocyanin